MASIFLINDNKIVSRLLQLSSEKHGYLLEEKLDVSPAKEYYDIVLVDSDKYTPELIEEVKNKITFGKLGYIGIKKESVPEGFDMHLDKPFLPSDFVSMIEENIQTIVPADKEEQAIPAEEVELEEEELILDLDEDEDTTSVDDLLQKTEENIDKNVEEELEALKELEELEGLEDFSFDELEEETSALGASADTAQGEEGALKDIEKTEDALKELESLDEELEDIDLSLDTSAVMSTGVAEQFVEEFSETKKEENITEDSDTASKTAVGAALAAATAAGAAMLKEDEALEEAKKMSEKEESQLTELDTLESGEDIEHESDYIKEEISAENLADEFDTLNEKEVIKALNGDATDEKAEEEILHEEIITEGEETMVESNDVEKWIRDAVAKAITPEMIKEALDGMEINVTLDFTKKDT